MDLSTAFDPNHYGAVDKLNDMMQFGHVVRVQGGKVTDNDIPNEREFWAPELHWEDDQIGHVFQTYSDNAGWVLLDGFSGQFRYSGPIMHESEYIGGRLARHILEHDGYYVALVCETIAEDGEEPELAGWAIAYRPLEDPCEYCECHHESSFDCVNDADAPWNPPTVHYVAGWNLPGYLPMSDPEAFETFEEATAFLVEILNRLADMHPDDATAIDAGAAANYFASALVGPEPGDETGYMVGGEAYWIRCERGTPDA